MSLCEIFSTSSSDVRIFGEFQVKWDPCVFSKSIITPSHREKTLMMNSTLFLRLGENNLDMDAVQVIADVLRVSESISNLG